MECIRFKLDIIDCVVNPVNKKIQSLIDKANCVDAWCIDRAGSYILSETVGLLSVLITKAQMSQCA